MTIDRMLLIALALAMPACRPMEAPNETPVSDAAYVWQYAWTPAVAQGVARATKSFHSFMVLAADVDARPTSFEHRVVSVRWDELAETGQQVWAVLRANHALSAHIIRSCDDTADGLARLFRNVLSDAKQGGLTLRGLQLDYDCPTQGLAEYAALMKALHARMPDTAWSITTLPTWLGQPAFAVLVADLDHFVLQVHSLEKPRDIDAPLTLCDTTRIAGWVKKASALNTPYYVALPTYGYRMFFKPGGEFMALAAEGTSDAPAGCTTREVSADPVALAEVVRTLRATPPKHCRGIVWFRLPVDTDQLNWPWPVLQKVMAGQAPTWAVTAEVRNVKQDLYEIWVRNEGAYRPSAPVKIPVHWAGARIVARDYVNGFRGAADQESPSDTLVGVAPDQGATAMAAWFRVGEHSVDKQPLFETGKVEAMP